KYKIREGTINLGKEYEVNVLTLLSLQCLNQTQEDFWFASNVDGAGVFDDIVLHLGGHIFMLQLKQTTKEIPKLITEHHLIASQKKEFYLKKIYIGHMQFTKTGPLSYLNSEKNSKIFQVEVEKVSTRLGLNDVKDISNFYIFSKQIDAKDVSSKIEEEIRKLTRSNYSKNVSEDFMKFIVEWSKGNLGGHFRLTKRDIVSKLTELLFSNYEIKLFEEPYNFYESKQKFVWNKIVKDKTVTIIDINSVDNLIYGFLLEYIGSTVKEYCNVAKRKSWFDNLSQKNRKLLNKVNPNLKWQLFKTAGNSNNIVLYHVYKSLWSFHKIPLVLEIGKKEHYRQILEVLKLSNYAYKVIILNKSSERLTLDRKIHHFENLRDLNEKDREEILKQQIQFQGRPGATLKDLVDETMFKKIKSADIINILLGTYSVAKQLNILPKYYIPRTFRNVLSYDALKYNISSCDIFLIEDPNRFYRHFATKKNIKVLFLDNNDLKNINDTGSIVVCSKPPELKQLMHAERCIHHLVACNASYLIWKKSYGKNCETEECQLKYCTLSENNFPFGSTTVISGDPGMGKSMLIDSIAQQIPTDRWVIKIDLRKHTGYYENLRNKNTELQAKEHLNHFKGSLDNELENKIFERLLRNKSIVILMDGFDEISISYKKEVTDIARSFHLENFYMYLTTRPIEKNHLEAEFSVLALEIRPFNIDNQKQLLKDYFSQNKKTPLTLNKAIDEFIEMLLKEFRKHINYDTTNDFSAIPLHIELLAEVFSDDCDKYLLNKNETDFNNILDIVDLYRRFINKKDKILCDKFGFNDSYFLYKDYERLLALNYLFPYCLYDIGELLKNKEANYIKVLEKCGILTVDEEFNTNFSHQTFAEYLAAEWLFRNIDNEINKIKNIVRSVYERCTGISEDGQHYPFLFRVFNRLVSEKSFDNGSIYKDMYLCVINGKIHEAKEIINLNDTVLNITDKAKRLILHLVVLYCEQYPLLKDVFSLIVEKTIQIHADVCGYNPIDYALRSRLYDMCDMMCKKWPYSKINVNPHYLNKEMYENRHLYPHMLNSIIVHYAYVDIMLKHVNKSNTIDSYIKKYIGSSIHFTSADLSMSEVPALKAYIKSNLCYQVTFGSIHTVKNMLQSTDKINMKDPRGYTPLHYAALYGKVEIIKLLLSKKAIVDTAEQKGQTPLYCSIKSGNFKVFCKLLDKANINSKTYSRYRPLHSAVRHKRIKMVDMLLSRGIDANTKDIWGAAPLHLIGQGHDRKSFFLFTSKESRIIDLLVSKGADINAKTLLGETALHYNASRGNGEIVNQLLQYNADVNVQNNEGDTPLHKAVISCKGYVVNLLLSSGADVNIKNNKGEPPLYYAVTYCNYKNVQELVHYEADINEQNKEGNTPLHKAVIACNDDVVGLLLINGANVNIKNDQGEHPLYFGIRCRNYKIVEELLRYGAEMNVQNNEEVTPLQLAISLRPHSYITNLLLANGARIFMGNENMISLFFRIKYGEFRNARILSHKAHFTHQTCVRRYSL
ncbi:hypothetical protein ILUMI_26433, partial [Ignelater luminosus]